LRYLARYATSERHLAQVLRRKALPEAAFHGLAPDQVEATITAILEQMRGFGYLDDSRYAAMKASSLAGKGRSEAMIRATLARQGVAREPADAALSGLREEHADPELAAARRLAHRRRLGPWRPAAERAAMRERDLAKLVRAGFSFAIARQAIEEEPDAG
jgi:regulatory protein